MSEQLREILIHGMQAIGQDANVRVVDGLMHYLAMMVKWNKVYNLTSITDPQRMVTHHLLDSLVVLPYLVGDRIIDIGTGGGLPGIPLALSAPDKQFVLLDSNSKKTRFVTQTKIELGLHHLEVVHSRAEEYHPQQPFTTVISRAYSTISDMLDQTASLCAPEGRFLAMKGTYPSDELQALSPGFEVENAVNLTVPELGAERHLIVIRRTA